jgi:hypothetical protein
MGIGASVFLIAIGAILAFAVNVSVSGLDLATVGWILMAAGTIGLLVALVMMNGWTRPRTTAVVEDGYDDVDRRVVRRRVIN